ncbi:glycerol-3-phosphate transporter domain protein [Clostridium botulinum]|nr:glycerol-3-phosphate transporter domain protein [Clostridium botulinum]
MLKDLFKPASHIERMPKGKIDSAYRRYRIQVFISIYKYLCRISNLLFCKK